MMDRSSSSASLDAIQAMLEPARRKLALRNVVNEIRRAATLMLAAAIVVALLELVAIVLHRRNLASIPSRVHWFAAGVSISALVAGTVLAIRTILRRRPTWIEVAQRLDAACDAHNRVATALSLLQQGTLTAFERAAVQQGVERLRQASDQSPVPPARQPLSRRTLVYCAGAVFLLGVAVTAITLPGKGQRPGATPATVDMDDLRSHAVAANLLVQTTPHPQRPDSETTADAAGTESGEDNGRSAGPGEPRTAGAQGAGSTGQGGRIAQVSSAGGSDKSRAPSASAGAPSKPTRSPKGESNSQSQGEQDDASIGAISGGGAGRGRSLAVKNQGAQRESPAGAELESIDDDSEIEDELSSNQQRGGVQPSLPDRTEAPSRELGITGPQSGRPGTGRGGPSPAKKSRGAAAMLMGVPIPDFVKGKAGPGPTAVSLEETAPSALGESASSAVPARPRSEDESPIQSREIPWSDAALVQEYCRRWQARPRKPADQAAPAVNPPVNQGANPP